MTQREQERERDPYEFLLWNTNTVWTTKLNKATAKYNNVLRSWQLWSVS